jgi:hypothetical protein
MLLRKASGFPEEEGGGGGGSTLEGPDGPSVSANTAGGTSAMAALWSVLAKATASRAYTEEGGARVNRQKLSSMTRLAGAVAVAADRGLYLGAAGGGGGGKRVRVTGGAGGTRHVRGVGTDLDRDLLQHLPEGRRVGGEDGLREDVLRDVVDRGALVARGTGRAIVVVVGGGGTGAVRLGTDLPQELAVDLHARVRGLYASARERASEASERRELALEAGWVARVMGWGRAERTGDTRIAPSLDRTTSTLMLSRKPSMCACLQRPRPKKTSWEDVEEDVRSKREE